MLCLPLGMVLGSRAEKIQQLMLFLPLTQASNILQMPWSKHWVFLENGPSRKSLIILEFCFFFLQWFDKSRLFLLTLFKFSQSFSHGNWRTFSEELGYKTVENHTQCCKQTVLLSMTATIISRPSPTLKYPLWSRVGFKGQSIALFLFLVLKSS